MWSIIPYTLVWMERFGINGALKHKISDLLKDEGGQMEKKQRYYSVTDDSSLPSARRLAEEMNMVELVRYWGVVNERRVWITGVAIVAGGYALVNEAV